MTCLGTNKFKLILLDPHIFSIINIMECCTYDDVVLLACDMQLAIELTFLPLYFG